ncbi:hypothetical protein [Pseudonocardia lacus]|uniref:hypothetical protein n=1 Tax=Pseudonocardia lacus TaxID=2835865 RepID=UPI001BDCEEEB|nr:hypothetical protein [Pseudonocardia lacus]
MRRVRPEAPDARRPERDGLPGRTAAAASGSLGRDTNGERADGRMNEYRGALDLSRAQLHEVLATAAAAPSLHDAQPWRFHVEPGRYCWS